MKKLYYTDAVEAAYMAKNFGVKLYAEHSDEQMSDYDLTEEQRMFNWFDSCSCEGSEEVEMISDAIRYMEDISDKIYIHPSSLHIFEPQIYDYVEYEMRDCTYVGDVPIRIDCMRWTKQLVVNEGLQDVLHPRRECIRKIIYRNGKPFIMPQEEHDSSE